MKRFGPTGAWMPVLLTTCLLGGCAVNPFGEGSGELTVRGVNDPGYVLRGRFDTSIYRFEEETKLDILMVEGAIEAPTQILHVRLMWQPIPARTPLDASATNAVVRYVNYDGPRVGVYEGGGFLFLKSPAGANLLRGELRQSNLRLGARSETFTDRADGAQLGALAAARGQFEARRDDRAVRRLLRQLRAGLKEQLGDGVNLSRADNRPAVGPASRPIH